VRRAAERKTLFVMDHYYSGEGPQVRYGSTELALTDAIGKAPFQHVGMVTKYRE